MTSDLTVQEMWIFLTTIIQMEHDIRDTSKDYWCTLEHPHTSFNSNMIKYHQFLCFCDSMGQQDNSYDKSSEN
jgi:hypothetical protein